MHTLNPDCMIIVPRPLARHRVAGPPLGRIAGLGGRVAGLAPASRTHPAPCRSEHVAMLSVVSRPAALYRDTNVAPSQPRYNFYIATQLPAKRTTPCRAHALGRLVASPRLYYRAVSWPISRHTQQPGHARRQRAQVDRVTCLMAVSWGRVAGLMAVSWPPCCTPLSPVSRYNALYRGQVQKWAVAQLISSPFFFSLIPATGKKTTQIYIYIYIYIFIFQYTQVNLLKFILFIFLQFYTLSNLRKISSHHTFFFRLILDHFAKISQTICSHTKPKCSTFFFLCATYLSTQFNHNS